MKFQELQEQVYLANMAIRKNRLARLTWGNASQIDRQAGVFAIKPSGVPYEELSPAKMVLVDLDGKSLFGEKNATGGEGLKASSDTATHLELYRAYENLGGICHTHSPYACAWAQAQREIPLLGTTHADYTVQNIPCTAVMDDAAIDGDYEVETGYQIIKRLGDLDPAEIEMILVACHGPFTWAKNARKAVENAVVLEEIARMAFYTVTLNPQVPELKETLRRKHYYRKHGSRAYYGQ